MRRNLSTSRFTSETAQKNASDFPPKLLLVIADSSRSGAPRQVLALLKGLLNHYAISLACPPGWLAEEANRIGIEVFFLPASRWKGRRFLRDLYRKIQPDLLHAHGVRGGILALSAAKKDSFPLLYTEHTWTADFPMKSRLRKFLHLWLLRKMLRRATKVIAVSEAVKLFLIEEQLVSPTKIAIIYGGIKPLKEVNPSQNRVIGMLGSLVRVKGVQLLLEAVALLLPDYPDVRCRIGGTGPDRLFFESLAEKLQISDHIEWLGEVQNLSSFFASIRIFVQPSLSEAFGLSVLEAMSAGIPVVVSNAGGLKEICNDDGKNSTGLCFQRGDVLAFSQELRRILDSQKLYEDLRESGRQRALVFSEDNMVKAYDQLYQQILAII